MKSETEKKPIRCERCGELLTPSRVKWLELSITDGQYYSTLPDGHLSQGAFPFGANCAKRTTRNK